MQFSNYRTVNSILNELFSLVEKDLNIEYAELGIRNGRLQNKPEIRHFLYMNVIYPKSLKAVRAMPLHATLRDDMIRLTDNIDDTFDFHTVKNYLTNSLNLATNDRNLRQLLPPGILTLIGGESSDSLNGDLLSESIVKEFLADNAAALKIIKDLLIHKLLCE